MKPQTEAQNSDIKDDLDLQDQEIEWVSKSQLKRDSKSLQNLGKQLVQLNPQQLARIPLDDSLLDAIQLAHKISNKRSALKRHFQFIGKLLRATDTDPIVQAVSEIENEHQQSQLLFKKLEQWRDRIVDQGDSAINECCNQHPQLDRQNLRQLGRNYRQAGSDEKKSRIARQIFQALRQGLETGQP